MSRCGRREPERPLHERLPERAKRHVMRTLGIESKEGRTQEAVGGRQ